MSVTLVPEDRPTPRVVNLSARGGLRENHWRNVRRRIDPHETTPFPGDGALPAWDRWLLRNEWWLSFSLPLGFLFLAGVLYRLVFGPIPGIGH